MSTLASDEVAADYKDGLEDLQTNDRSQINILTMIARESIEHAEAIARTLTNHIKKAPPARKLPALYVLDSIVKNVGSPYNIYFGRNLHETFMLAYSQVDQPVRKKLEEMLQTWRQPVPGSLSSTPVFPLSATQTIVESLAKYKASTTGANRYPQQQQPPRPSSIVQAPVDYRGTSTPPQFAATYPHPTINVQHPTPTPPPQQFFQQPPQAPSFPQAPTPSYAEQNGYQQAGLQQYPNVTTPLSHPLQQPMLAQPLQARPPSQSGVDVGKLHADIDDLTTDAKIVCMTHPMDQQAQKKLASLQQIKEMLESGTLSEDDLVDLRNSIMQQIAQRSAEQQRQQQTAAAQAFSPYQPVQQPSYAQYAQPYAYLQLTQQPEQPPAIPSFINSANLAGLLRATANKSQTNPMTFPLPGQVNTPPPQHALPVPTTTELPLLAQLRASGFLSNNPTPPQGPTPPAQFANLSINDVPFTSPSLKIERPHLLLKFLNAKPNQCSTCGRRFTSDAAGQQKKEKHLDWHFKTKSRQVEAEQRGQNRSWYVDEREWIANKEFDDDADVEADGQANVSLAAAKKEEDIVRAPSDPVTRNAVCPIDQEPFRSEWSADIQDFVWRDALRVGDRYFHASCYREMMKGRETLNGAGAQPVRAGTPLAANHRRTATPDSVLGKRKADDEEHPPPSSASKMSKLAVPAVKAEQT